MRVTANQVTLARLLLLPLPVTLLYQAQGRTAYVVAVVSYLVLGLTDALDGALARRYGSTPLGAFLDPIVDKIFLAACYVPLADKGIFGSTAVVLIFIRELAVTKLRSIAEEESFVFRTTRVAKLKTTVQMAGAGFILLVWVFPEDRLILPILGACAALSAVPPILAFARGRTPDWRATWGFLLITGTAVSRAVASPRASIVVILVVAVGLTLYSGAEYLWAMRRILLTRIRQAPVEAIRLAALSLVVPGLFVPVLERPGAPTVSILLLIAAELAAGGLDNFLAQTGRYRSPRIEVVRPLLQAVAGAVIVARLAGAPGMPPAVVPALVALGVTVADLAIRLVPNLAVLRAEADRSA